VYKPTVNGSRVNSFNLETGKTIENKVRKISFLDNSDQGKEENLPVMDGKIMVDVLEKPILVLYKEQ